MWSSSSLQRNSWISDRMLENLLDRTSSRSVTRAHLLGRSSSAGQAEQEPKKTHLEITCMHLSKQHTDVKRKCGDSKHLRACNIKNLIFFMRLMTSHHFLTKQERKSKHYFYLQRQTPPPPHHHLVPSGLLHLLLLLSSRPHWWGLAAHFSHSSSWRDMEPFAVEMSAQYSSMLIKPFFDTL